jgi:hypothetical protein
MPDQNNQYDDSNYADLVDPINEYVHTDSVTDLKSGIFNLFNNLFQTLSVTNGPVKALEISLRYLQDIIDHFQTVLTENDNNK